MNVERPITYAIALAITLCGFLGLTGLTLAAVGPQSPNMEMVVTNSSLIAVGVVLHENQVVWPEKLYPGPQELPQRSKYMAGTVYQVRIQEIVKGDKKARVAATIEILIPGASGTSDSPTLVLGRKYLVCLSFPGVGEKEYEGAVLMDLKHSPSQFNRLDFKTVYIRASGVHSLVQ